MIPVAKPFLPLLENNYPYLKGMCKGWWLLVNEQEFKVKEYLNVPLFLFLTNNTITLQVTISALELSGEIIKIPFSCVVTTKVELVGRVVH